MTNDSFLFYRMSLIKVILQQLVACFSRLVLLFDHASFFALTILDSRSAI